MIVSRLNRQRAYSVAPFRAIVESAVAAALSTSADVMAYERDRDTLAVSVIFVGPRQIQAINRETRGCDQVTDVLSFPLLDAYDGHLQTIVSDVDFEPLDARRRALWLGDIVLCLKAAARQAAAIGHSVEREVMYLVVHSALHLIGYDHEEEARRRTMRAVETRVMQALATR